MAGFVSGAEQTLLMGLGGTGSGSAPMGAEWNFRIVAKDDAGLLSGRQWFEKITGDVGANIWTHRGAPEEQREPVFLLTAEALFKQHLARLRQNVQTIFEHFFQESLR